MQPNKYRTHPVPEGPRNYRHSRDYRHLKAPAGRLLTLALGMGWAGMRALTKFAFKIPRMFVRANRRASIPRGSNIPRPGNISKNTGPLLLLLLCTQAFQGCSAIEGIFKAGVWVGVIAVVLIVGIILFIVGKISGGKKS